MNSTQFAPSVQLNIDAVVTFQAFCDILNLTETTRRQLRKSLQDDDQFVDLGQEHGGCFEVRLGWDHLRRVSKAVREKQERDAERQRKKRAK